MLSSERHHKILRFLGRHRYAALHDIVDMVGVSETTVRRDFSFLEEKGYLNRVHGGVELTERTVYSELSPLFFDEPPFESRKDQNSEAKRKIAQKATELCTDGETIMIDGGSTTFHMAPSLREKRLHIITNSFAMTEELVHHSENQVTIVGGLVYPNSQLILNPFDCEEFLKNYYAAKLFMGAGGIDENGATNTEMLLIETERTMIKQSKQLILLCDSSKFSKQGDLFLCALDDIDTIITDEGISESQQNFINEKGVTLFIV